MTGAGHRWTGIGAGFFAAALARVLDLPELVAAAIAMSTTTMPDWLEVPFYKNGVRSGSLIAHRTLTHWPFLWLAVIAASVYLGGWIGGICLGGAVGALTHILGDSPNPMGIPWLLPHKRLKFGRKGWWKSGQYELLLIVTFALAGFAAWRLANLLAPEGATYM